MMKRVFNYMLTVMVLVALSTAHGQERRVVTGNQQWLQHYQQVRISERWTLGIDGGFRWRQGFTDQSQYIIRAGGLYRLAEGVNIGGGLVLSGLYLNGNIFQNEIRPYQEINHSIPIGKSMFIHRFRLEERFFKNKITGADRFNWRFRYSILIKLHLSKLSEKGHALLLNVSDEIFLNAGKEIVYNFYDQNRLIIGPAVKFPSGWEAGISYNYQFAATRVEGLYAQDHVFWFTTRHSLP